MRLDRSSHRLLLSCTCRHSSLRSTAAGRFQSVETLAVSNGNLVVLGRLEHFIQILQRFSHLIQSDVASASLVESQRRLVDIVCIGECLCCIFVGTCRHEQIACVYVNHWVLRFDHNQLLEVHEGQARVSDQIGTLATVEISIEQIFIQVDSDGKICDCLLKHA